MGNATNMHSIVAGHRNRRIMQNSWVVHDIEAAMRQWLRSAGVGPFFVVKGVTLEDQRYRGKPAPKSIDVTFALAQAGDIQIELVCQHNDVPSAYRDTVPAGRSAFHHMALYSHEYDSDLADYTRQGYEVAFSGAFAGKRFCYVDTSADIGCMIELIEASEAQEGFFKRIIDAAKDWDGSDPIRPAF
jgi:Glyoxalase/Bleomycin resistance protein/Dioxygenase superfamily